MLTCAFSLRNSKLAAMSPPTHAFNSSVGMKLLIGLTGLALLFYSIIHIAGNPDGVSWSRDVQAHTRNTLEGTR